MIHFPHIEILLGTQGFRSGVDCGREKIWTKWLKTALKLQNQHFGSKAVGKMRGQANVLISREVLQPPSPTLGKTLAPNFSFTQKSISVQKMKKGTSPLNPAYSNLSL